MPQKNKSHIEENEKFSILFVFLLLILFFTVALMLEHAGLLGTVLEFVSRFIVTFIGWLTSHNMLSAFSLLFFIGLVLLLFVTQYSMDRYIRNAERALDDVAIVFSGTYWYFAAVNYVKRRKRTIQTTFKSLPFWGFISIATAFVYFHFVAYSPALQLTPVGFLDGGSCLAAHEMVVRYFSASSIIAKTVEAYSAYYVRNAWGFSTTAALGVIVSIIFKQTINLARGHIEPISYLSYSAQLLIVWVLSYATFHQFFGDGDACRRMVAHLLRRSGEVPLLFSGQSQVVDEWYVNSLRLYFENSVNLDMLSQVVGGHGLINYDVGAAFFLGAAAFTFLTPKTFARMADFATQRAFPLIFGDSLSRMGEQKQELDPKPKIQPRLSLSCLGLEEDDIKQLNEFGIYDVENLATFNPFIIWVLLRGPQIEIERLNAIQIYACAFLLVGQHLARQRVYFNFGTESSLKAFFSKIKTDKEYLKKLLHIAKQSPPSPRSPGNGVGAAQVPAARDEQSESTVADALYEYLCTVGESWEHFEPLKLHLQLRNCIVDCKAGCRPEA